MNFFLDLDGNAKRNVRNQRSQIPVANEGGG
jgi:hypothetical protein